MSYFITYHIMSILSIYVSNGILLNQLIPPRRIPLGNIPRMNHRPLAVCVKICRDESNRRKVKSDRRRLLEVFGFLGIDMQTTHIKLRVVSNHTKSELRPNGVINAFLKSLITQNKSLICTLKGRKQNYKIKQ